MNNNTSQLSSNIDEQSLETLRATFVINILLNIFLCLITTLSNVATIFIISKGGKTFSTNHYKLIVHSSCAATVEAFYCFCSLGIVRLIDTMIGHPESITTLKCALILLPADFCWTLKMVNLFQIAVDRLVAVACPVKYRNYGFSNVYVYSAFGFCWTMAVVDQVAKFGLYTKSFSEILLPICSIANTNPPLYFTFKNTRNMILCCLTLLIYLAAVLLVKRQMNVVNSNLLKKQVGYKLMVTSGVDAIVYCFTLFLAQIYASVVIPSSSVQSKIFLTPIGFTFVLLSTTPRFVIYYFLNKDFNTAAKKMFCCCSTTKQQQGVVEPTLSSVTQTKTIELKEMQQFNRHCKRRLALKGIEKYQGFVKPSVTDK